MLISYYARPISVIIFDIGHWLRLFLYFIADGFH